MKNNTVNMPNKDRLVVLATLAKESSRQTEIHSISDKTIEQLCSYIDGNMPEDEQVHFKNRLINEPGLYNLWLEVEKSQPQAQLQNQPVSILQQFKGWFANPWPSLALCGILLAMLFYYAPPPKDVTPADTITALEPKFQKRKLSPTDYWFQPTVYEDSIAKSIVEEEASARTEKTLMTTADDIDMEESALQMEIEAEKLELSKAAEFKDSAPAAQVAPIAAMAPPSQKPEKRRLTKAKKQNQESLGLADVEFEHKEIVYPQQLEQFKQVFLFGISEYIAAEIDLTKGWRKIISALPASSLSCVEGDESCEILRQVSRDSGYDFMALKVKCAQDPGQFLLSQSYHLLINWALNAHEPVKSTVPPLFQRLETEKCAAIDSIYQSIKQF